MNYHEAVVEAISSYYTLTGSSKKVCKTTKPLLDSLEEAGFSVLNHEIVHNNKGETPAARFRLLNQQVRDEVLDDPRTTIWLALYSDNELPYLAKWRNGANCLPLDALMRLAKYMEIDLTGYSVAPYSLTYAGSK